MNAIMVRRVHNVHSTPRYLSQQQPFLRNKPPVYDLCRFVVSPTPSVPSTVLHCSLPAARRSEAGGQSTGGLEAGASARVSSKQTLAGGIDMSTAAFTRTPPPLRNQFSFFLSHTHIYLDIYPYILTRTGTFSLAGRVIKYKVPCNIRMCQGLSGSTPLPTNVGI